MPEGGRPRVLVSVLVYNGKDFVPRCLDSVSRLEARNHDKDILVLDDCSPEPGCSEELRAYCKNADFRYYRSPRNLGITRNMNLALGLGLQASYDYVLLLNSDVIVAENLVEAMVKPMQGDEAIASATAWSNNVAIFSLPNEDPEGNLATPQAVNWVGRVLDGEFSGRVMDLPSAVGFCMMLRSSVIKQVGLFDPIFGRGYCEEIDWTQRTKNEGFRNVLVPGAFAYHAGSGSARKAGMLEHGQTSVPENEAIIDFRYPDFRNEVNGFLAAGKLASLANEAKLRLIRTAAKDNGYFVEAAWLSRAKPAEKMVRFTAKPAGADRSVDATYMGYSATLPPPDARLISGLEKFIGRAPLQVAVFDRGPTAEALAREAGGRKLKFVDRRSYPERV